MSAAKQHILAEIKRLAEAAGGKPPGIRAFRTQTAIKESDWNPHLWLRWSEALQEAGFSPNAFREPPQSDEILLESFARFTQRLGHIPIRGELIRESMTDSFFPNEKAFRRRFGGKEKLLTALRVFCRARSDFADVIAICDSALTTRKAGLEPRF